MSSYTKAAKLHSLPYPVFYEGDTNSFYGTVKEFFEYMFLPEWQNELREWFRAAYSESYSWSNLPCYLLYSYELLQHLIEAAYLLLKEQGKSGTGGNTAPRSLKSILQQLLGPAHFRDLFTEPQLAWSYLPHHLNSAETADPFLVLENFFSFQSLPEWKDELHDWLIAAFHRISICQSHTFPHMLLFCGHLEKFIDAAHLIMVRGTEEEDNAI